MNGLPWLNEVPWTPEDSAAATKEGWDIFESGFGHEIQRVDEPDGDGSSPKFNSDAEAIAHVYWLAHEDSDLHLRAMLYSLQK